MSTSPKSNESLQENEETQKKEPQQNIVSLQLGDVIKIEDPTNDILNNNTFIIDYIDKNIIKLVNVDDLSAIQLRINEEGIIAAGTITTIDLIYRNVEEGYARQNNLLPGTWINIFFGGDTPVVITGEITNLEEDMIEIKVFPDNDVLYINFGYKGIPEDLPIDTIEIRKAPEKKYESAETAEPAPLVISKETPEEESFGPELEEEYFEPGKVFIPPNEVKNQLKEFIIRADEIHFGRELGPITQFVDVDTSQQRFTIETQTNELLDELLSRVPNPQRTTRVLNNIHIMIERFKQLRENFSDFDNYGNVENPTIKGYDWKPLSNELRNPKILLYWILPVVKNIKKVYNISTKEDTTYPDIVPFITSEDLVNIKGVMDSYDNDNVPIEQNKYINMVNELNPYFTPFTDTDPETNNDVISSFNVECDLNTIIDSLGDFYSSIAQNDAIKTRKFVMTKYNTGLTRLETTQLTGSKMIAHRVKLTPSDTLEIKSIITLPEPTIRFSNINLPGTNILYKSNLNNVFLNYWQMLKQKTNVQPVMIDDIEKELEFNEENYVNNIKSYNLEFKEEYKTLNDKLLYKKYLDVIVPKTRVLFNLMKKYITGKLSIVDIVTYLEPFLVYTDDLTYMQFKEINTFLEIKITDYNKNFVDKGKSFNTLKRSFERLTNKPSNNTIFGTLQDHNMKQDILVDGYDISNSIDTTNSEVLTTITETDYGNLFYNALSLENINLMLPNDVSALLEEQKDLLDTQVTNAEEKNKCVVFVIAKQYSNVADLNEDNGKTIYFDRKYDNTPYSILDDYEKEQIKMSPEEFNEFLVKKLRSKYKYGEEDAGYMADTLINGMKQVVDGNIAILFVNEESKINYYRRDNNRWELDENVKDDTFNANNQSMLCNFQQGCIEVQQRFGSQFDSQFNSKCESYDLNKKEIKQKAIKEIMDEFDKNYRISKEELEIRINRQFDYYKSIIDKLKMIKHKDTYKYNDYQYELGAISEESSLAHSEELVVSPYLKLRDIILGQADFIQKQSNIVRFATRFTREATELEDEHWTYCIETNTKLLPAFMYILSSQFVEDPNYYIEKLDEIKKINGAISDDGDSWVDKFSGYVICKIDADVDEGYEEGFRVSTRAIMEQDAGDALLNAVNKKQIEFQNVEAQMAYNVIYTMAENMGINIQDQREFMIKIFSNMLTIALPSEAQYKLKAEELSKKGKTVPDYKKVYNVTILYLALGALLIGIQTSIPSIKTRKTFPGCVRSFIGFPFDGLGDLSALNYISCIAYKIRKSGDDPWSGFSGVKETVVTTKLKETIETYYLNNADVIQKFNEKTDYLLSNPVDDIPAEHDLSKWLNFLPPLVIIKIKNLENISDQLKTAFLKDMKTGSREQREKSLIVESKIIFFSLAIQERIQKIISKKQLILANSSNEPFLENACCNHESRSEVTTLQYFEKEDSDITQFNYIVRQLSDLIYDIVSIVKAPYLFSRENTKNIYPSLSDEFSEETIYRAFITFCRFNSLASLNEELIAICTDKPNYLNIADSISDKIKKLKQDGRIYNNDAMLRLLQIVGRQNIVHLSFINEKSTTPIQKVRNILEHITDSDEEVIPASLVQNIANILDTYDIAVQEDTDEMRSLKNYLGRSNIEMKREIFEFLGKYGKLTKREKAKTKDIIDKLMVWEDLGTDMNERSISDDAMYNAIEFIKSYLQNIVKIFPNIILNSVNYQDIPIPKYLGLSTKHANDVKLIVSKYYSSLNAFYKNKTLINVLNTIEPRCANLLMLANNTPSFTDIKYKGATNHSIFDRKTSLLLFENYFLETVKEYINLSSDESMLVREMRSSVENEEEIEARTVESMEDIVQRLDMGTMEQIQVGNIKDLKEKTAELLLSYLNIMNEHKNTIDLSYDRIMDLVFKTREREKDTFTDRLQAKSDEERQIDTILKINKLGVWSKGLQKGLTSYVKDTYDDEREYMEQLGEVERKVMRNKNVNDRNVDQYMDDILEEQEATDFIDREENDIAFLTENYMDGDYQGENEEDYGDYN